MNKRIKRAIVQCVSSRLDALLISSSLNITYLTGFREAEGYLLLTRAGEMTYFTNPLYKEEAAQVSSWQVVISRNNIFSDIAAHIKRSGFNVVGFEAKIVPFLEYEKFKEYLEPAQVTLKATIDLVEGIRSIKEPAEIVCLKKAAAVSREAFEYIDQIYSVSMTEKVLAIEAERFLRLKGDNEIAFPAIVASGKNGANPHHLPGHEKLGGASFLTDLGSKHSGYCADLTRVFFWGKISLLFKRIYATVQKAQERALCMIKDGVSAQSVDRAARAVIEKAGWGKHFGHGVGHGVGLAVHEPPFISYRSQDVLKEGMVVTLEPGIYLPGKFGVRIEDMVVVTKRGAQLISKSEKRR